MILRKNAAETFLIPPPGPGSQITVFICFRAGVPGSEIVRKSSESVSCSRTSERAGRAWFLKKVVSEFFFLTERRRERSQ